jgi:hypothetical protein
VTIANEELLQKATYTTDALVAQGTSLSIEQVTTFLRLAITPQVMLPDVRTVTSAAAKWQEAHIDFASRVLRPGTQGTRLADADRVNPQTEMVEIDTVLVRGEVPISDEVMEDNFEREGFGNTVMAMVAEASGRDIEDLMLNGDTSSGDAYYALTDGWVKRLQGTGSNVLTGSTYGDDYQSLFLALLQQLPAKYKLDKPNMRFYVPLMLEENYRASLAGRGTPLGDAILSGSQPLMFQDVAIVPVPLLNVNSSNQGPVILAHRLNLYAGFHRQIRMETWRDPREGATSWVITARVAPNVGHVPATAIATNVNCQG